MSITNKALFYLARKSITSGNNPADLSKKVINKFNNENINANTLAELGLIDIIDRKPNNDQVNNESKPKTKI